MIDSFLSFFYNCKNRFFHCWEYVNENTRTCKYCTEKQIVVGWYSFMDADAIKQWGKVEKI